MQIELKPCPFCGGAAHIEQPGTRRQSCVVECDSCGINHESGDEGEMCGTSWNRRIAAHSAGAQEPVAWAVYNGWSKIAFYISEEGARDHAKAAQRSHDLSGSLAAFRVVPLYAHPQPMPQTDAARDAKRMDWLCEHTVNVRDPLPLGGSHNMFWVSPNDDDGGRTPSNLREKIDTEIERIDRAAAKGGDDA